MLVLRQSTAVDVLIGPFVDSTDGYTAETGVSPSVSVSKNGQALAAKNDATTPTHDADGYYNCELDATDTNTVGTLVLIVPGSATSLPVRHEYQVIEEDAYDAIYASGAHPVETGDLPSNFGSLAITGGGAVTAGTVSDKTGYSISGTKQTLDALNDVSAADVNAQCDTAISDAALATAANLATVDANVDAILVDTGTDIPARFDGIEGATFSSATDSLEAIRDRGDSAWTTGGGGSAPTAAEVADAVWDEARSGHTTAGSFGEGVNVEALNTQAKADVNAEADTAISDAALATAANLATVDSNVDAILVDTNELQTDWTNGGRLDLIVDGILEDTGTTIPASITALNDLDAAGIRTALGFATASYDTDIAALPTAAENATAVLTTAMTESYSTDGGTKTVAQALYEIAQILQESTAAGTTVTVKRVDGSTTAMTFTLDSSTAPTSITRAT